MSCLVKSRAETPIRMAAKVLEDSSTVAGPKPHFDLLKTVMPEFQQTNCGSTRAPNELHQLTYKSTFRQIIEEKANPSDYSESLLLEAEKVWSWFNVILDSKNLPKIVPGEDDFIVFLWASPKRRFEANIFVDDVGAVAYDWVQEIEGRISSNSPTDGVKILLERVVEFASTCNS